MKPTLKPYLIALTILLVFPSIQHNSAPTIYKSKGLLLLDSINKYRVQNGLHSVPYSEKLSKVAREHCMDLEKNYTLSQVCNLHSWSATSSKWNACCYTSDHARAKCMWDKPREISNYDSEGYEVAYYNSESFDVYRPLERWKVSKKGHNNVLLNLKSWKKIKWKAVGVGISDHYACVWFGNLTDSTSLSTKD